MMYLYLTVSIDKLDVNLIKQPYFFLTWYDMPGLYNIEAENNYGLRANLTT